MKETLKNLIASYLGECQARARYEYYAKIAAKEGSIKIQQIFQTTANQEKTHAKRFFEHIQELKKELNDDTPIIMEIEPELRLGDTQTNLEVAIYGETHEELDLYPKFAETADKEGLHKIATRFRMISIAERHHKKRFQAILDELKNNSFFKKETKVYWACLECGYLYEGEEPPKICPSCDHPKEYYELLSEKF
jgi:rubrerythrin